MSRSTSEIISDAEIERVHANANFGDTSKRAVVDEGVLSYALGYHTGHTMTCILQEHKLISCRKGPERQTLTKKGFKYLHSMFGFTSPYAILKAAIRTEGMNTK